MSFLRFPGFFCCQVILANSWVKKSEKLTKPGFFGSDLILANSWPDFSDYFRNSLPRNISSYLAPAFLVVMSIPLIARSNWLPFLRFPVFFNSKWGVACLLAYLSSCCLYLLLLSSILTFLLAYWSACLFVPWRSFVLCCLAQGKETELHDKELQHRHLKPNPMILLLI